MHHEIKSAIKRLLRPFHIVTSAKVNGVRFNVPIARGVGGSHRNAPEPWMVDVLSRLFAVSGRGGLIDVGVNLGQTLLKMRSIDRTATYIGFEPNPFCVVYVNELIALNRFRDCTVVPVALSTGAGLANFSASHEADTAASIVDGLRPGTVSIRRQFVPTLAFDDIASTLPVESLPVVKIDVEGAELEVLLGMRKFLEHHRPAVVFEVLHAHSERQLGFMHSRNASLIALTVDLGYVVKRIRKHPAVALEPVSAFPDAVYTSESPAVCDYLMVPREIVRETESAFR